MKLLRDTCRSIRDLLPLHVGGDLDASQARRVDGHLHDCLTCFREYRVLATMRGRLGVLAEQPLPAGLLDDFTEQVMERIAMGEDGPAAELPGVRARRVVPVRPLAAAALLLVALSLGLALGTRWGGGEASDGRGRTPPRPVFDAGTDAGSVAGAVPVATWPALEALSGRPATLPQLGIRVGDFRTSMPVSASLDARALGAPHVPEPGMPTMSTRDRQLMEAFLPTLRPALLHRGTGGLEPDTDPTRQLRPRHPGFGEDDRVDG